MRDKMLLADVQVTLEWATRRHWESTATIYGSHPGVPAVFLVESGALRVDMAGSAWRIPAGAALLLPAGVQRDRIATAEGAEDTAWLSLGLRPRLYGRLPVEGPFAVPHLWEPDAVTGERLRRWTGEIVDLWSETEPASRAAAEGLAKAVFTFCWRGAGNAAPPPIAPSAPDWLLRTLRRIADAPETPLPTLCIEAAVSPAHLRRIFHQYVGVSPQAYLTDRRLERARDLLGATDLLVADVAERIGFESASHFTRLFAARFGASPARYRQQVRTPRS